MTTLRHPSGYLRQLAHKKPHNADWRLYESRKQEYIVSHPEVTPTAYEAEMKRIAKELNI